jgi:hypothetical protein
MVGSAERDQAVLVSFAILSTNWEERKLGYVDNFVPFVADCLRRSTSDAVSAPAVRDCILTTFGLRLPIAAVQAVLERCRKLKLVQASHHVLYRNQAEVQRFDIAKTRARAVREYEGLVDSFVEYCNNAQGASIDRDSAGTAIVDYVERRSLPIMRHMLGAEALRIPEAEQNQSDYLVASFITIVCESDPIAFGFLETVVKGSMLATASPNNQRREQS